VLKIYAISEYFLFCLSFGTNIKFCKALLCIWLHCLYLQLAQFPCIVFTYSTVYMYFSCNDIHLLMLKSVLEVNVDNLYLSQCTFACLNYV